MNEEVIEKSVRKLRKLLKKAPKRPDPEFVHDLRTRSCKFESILTALKPKAARRDAQLLRGMKRVRSRAGKVRDMDVLTGHAATLQQHDEQQCLVQLLEELGRRRAEEAKKLRRVISRRGPLLRRKLKRSARKLEKKLRNGSNQRTMAEAAARVLQLSSDLRNPARLNRSNLHPYRLKVKELRYVLQLAGNPKNGDFIGQLGEVKDAIGEWHDWEELIAIAEQVQSHDGSCRLVKGLKDISQQKFDQAIGAAEELRGKFLQAHKMPAAREAPALPVIEAAAKMAA